MKNSAVRIIAEPVKSSPITGAVIACAGRRREPAVLDSTSSCPAHGRYTIIACEPIATYAHRPGDGDPFHALRSLLAATGMLEVSEAHPALPFAGGWIGYFAYEAGRFIERLPATTACDVGLPLARFSLYDSAAVYDHATESWTVVAADFGPEARSLLSQEGLTQHTQIRSAADRIAWWKGLLAAASDQETAALPGLSSSPVGTFALMPAGEYGPIVHNLTRDQHLQIVQRGRDYIAAGDIFQVNLARRESVPAVEHPLDVYLRLRQANPGAYSAYLGWLADDDPSSGGRETYQTAAATPGFRQCAVLSSSPELFLDVRGRQVITRPIKGTRPRSSDPAADEALRLELAGSRKDRAELAMIVDLERNDLGRVCEFGSVEVVRADSPAAPFDLERHATVHHLVATVTGRLTPGCDAIDLLRASFPGGSITGAPKVRAMEIIDELEPTERSVYTGAIGYFAPGGRMAMNIAIRTIIQSRGMLHWYAGGGIVADSEPAAEYDETCAKVLGIRRALGLQQDGV